MSIKLIAVDIDGTLLNSQRQVTPEVFQAIQDAKAAGVKVVIATGRPIPGVLPLLEELNLNQDGDYVITFNGGLVQETSTGNELIRETLSYEDYLDIEVLANKLGVHSHAITKDGIYTSNRNIGRYTVHESTLVHMPIYYRTPEEVADKEFVKAMYIDEPEILDAAIAKLPQEFYDRFTIVKSTPFYLEILKKTANKGIAVTHLAEKLSLTKEETMAIGDEENDRAMLEVVGSPVVMENGNPEIKKIAKYITKSNDESGVAYAIRKWVLRLICLPIKIGISTSEHDRFVIDSPQTNLLQSSSWAKIKDSWGNDRLGFYQDDKLVAVASVLIQPLPLGFSMIYIPRGPIMDYQDKELLAFVITSLKKYAKTKRALFVKFDPSLFVTKNLISQEVNINEDTLSIAKDIQASGR